MGIAVRYTLFCDGCRRTGPGIMGGGHSRQEERRIARKAGWRRIPKGSPSDPTHRGSGMDVCPSCVLKYPDAK